MPNETVYPYPIKTEIKTEENQNYTDPKCNDKQKVVDPKTIDRLTGQIIIPGFSHQR